MNVTVEHSIEIAAPPEAVWDFTQDWTRRQSWDPAVRRYEILEQDPPVVRVSSGGLTFVSRYKLYDRPRQTSLAITDVSPALVVIGGGGSWSYAAAPGGGTTWTQTNTVKLRDGLAAWLFGGLVRFLLRRSTVSSMNTARAMIEAIIDPVDTWH